MSTRKTHIVRIYDDSSGTKDLNTYVDVEVLDAVTFRHTNNREQIIKVPAKKATPLIIDDLNLGVGKDPGRGATRKSHMKKITSSDKKSFFAVEVLDAVTFRGRDGKEWILKMPSESASPYNVTDGGAGSSATRRTHSEKLYFDPKNKGKKDADYITVERCDAVAFRHINDRELILKMPSYDDDSGDRAATITTPENYDPTDDDMKVPENEDPHVYVKFMKDSESLVTKDAKIACGPLWWIRKVHQGSEWLVIEVKITRKNTNQSFDLEVTSESPSLKVGTYEINSDPKKMPFSDSDAAGAKPDDLDLKKDKLLRGNVNPDNSAQGSASDTDWTSLVFLNVSLLKEKSETKVVTVDLKFTGFKGDKPTDATVGYYSWAISGGDQFTPIPIHPPPDADNAFSPYPFGDVMADTYISLWNNWGVIWSDLVRKWRDAGITIPPEPDAGAYGWSTRSKAQAFVDAINALDVYDYEHALAIIASLPFHIQPPAPPTLFEVLVIDFGAPPAAKKPELDAEIRALHYKSRTNYPYDSKNVQGWPDPKLSDDLKTKTVSQHVPSEDRTITVRLDKNGLSISG